MRRRRMDAGHEDRPHVCDMDINFVIFVFRKLFTTILTSGATKRHTTLPGEGLGLIHKRPSCQLIGRQPSPRSLWVWTSATNYGSLLSTSPLVRCTLWSLTANTAPHHSVVTSGRRWLVHRPPYRTNVTRKGSMLSAAINQILKQELVSPVMRSTIVSGVTQYMWEWGFLFTRQWRQAHQDHGLHRGSVIKAIKALNLSQALPIIY